MILRETEFEKASALDSSEFENIRNEFFKKTVVHPLIGIIIAAAVASLWFTGVIQKLYVISDVITTAGGVLHSYECLSDRSMHNVVVYLYQDQ